jgi:hypothetical protein
LKNFTFSVVVAHYGDSFWVKKALISAGFFDLNLVKSVFIIDNNHGDKELLVWSSRYPKLTILEYPPGGSGNAHHAHALNSFFGEQLLTTSHVIIIDSDLIANDITWMDELLQILESSEACLALDPISDYLTHPCFMVIPTRVSRNLDFMEGMIRLKIDTGRTLGLQLIKLGIDPYLLKPKHGYGGKMGFTYLNEKLYHVTSISIRQQPHKRQGKSTLRITLAESWRRWVVVSKLPRGGGWAQGAIFDLIRALYCAAFVSKWCIENLLKTKVLTRKRA